jgi:hypothetical protein
MSRDGQASSAGSWAAGNPFVDDAGPRFDPDDVEASAPATPLTLADVGWEPDRVRTILRAQGLTTHQYLGVGEQDWLWAAHELEAIAEPLANVGNKIPVVRAAAAVSDELTVAAVLGEYVIRSYSERVRVLRAAKKAQQQAAARPRPITGYAPDDVGAQPAQPAQPTSWEVLQ